MRLKIANVSLVIVSIGVWCLLDGLEMIIPVLPSVMITIGVSLIVLFGGLAITIYYDHERSRGTDAGGSSV